MYWSIHGSPVTAVEACADEVNAAEAASVTSNGARLLRPMEVHRMTEPASEVTQQPASSNWLTRERVVGAAVASFVVLIGWRHGGYELPITGEIALLASWLVLIGAILGLIPTVRVDGSRLWAVLFLGGFLAWDLISVSWSNASGRTVATAVQIGAVLSVLLAGVVTVRKQDRTAVLAGVLTGVALLAALASGSRLHPEWFPDTAAVGALGKLRPRLYWPVGYWNALAYLAAMSLPLALHFAVASRKGMSRALAGASIPLISVTVLFAISRGGVATAVFAVLLAFILGPINKRRIAGLLAGVASSGVVVASALSGSQLMDGLTDSGAGAQQAKTTLLILIAASLAMATVCVSLEKIPVSEDPAPVKPWFRLGAALGFVTVLIVLFLAAGGGPKFDKAFKDFRNPHLSVGSGRANSVDRLAAQSSNGRWQLWSGAIDAGSEKPMTGTGGGTFELWWTQHRTNHLSVRNAHSLYLEAWSDLGLIGLLLMLGFVVSLGWGCVSGLRRAGPDLGVAAAGSATVVAFALSSGVDWGWQVTVIPAVAVLTFTGVAAPDHELAEEASPVVRGVVGLVAVLLLALSVPPTVASHALIDSRQHAAKGQWSDAIGAARSARRWQPYSAEAWLQEGLAEEASGNTKQAVTMVRGAIKREPGAWQPWLVLAGLAAKQGDLADALKDYRRARDLNPTSQLFETTN